MAIDIHSFVPFAPGLRRMYLSLPPGTSPGGMQQALLHLLLQPISRFRNMHLHCSWSVRKAALRVFTPLKKQKLSTLTGCRKIKPFSSFPHACTILNNIFVSELGQIPAHAGHAEPQKSFLTQSLWPKIFMHNYVCMDVFIFASNYAAARHFTGLSSLCLQQIVSLMS